MGTVSGVPTKGLTLPLKPLDFLPRDWLVQQWVAPELDDLLCPYNPCKSIEFPLNVITGRWNSGMEIVDSAAGEGQTTRCPHHVPCTTHDKMAAYLE